MENLKTETQLSFHQLIVSDEYEIMVSLSGWFSLLHVFSLFSSERIPYLFQLPSAKVGKNLQLFRYDLQEIHSGAATGTKIEDTKGCSHFDLAVHSESGELQLAALIKKTVAVYLWQSTTCSFMKIRDVPVPDQAVLVKLVNDSLFVATKSEMLVVNMKDWTSHNISLADNSTSKIDPVSINQMDKEVLLNYNSEFCFCFLFLFLFFLLFASYSPIPFLTPAVGVPVSAMGKRSRDTLFKWSAIPSAVGEHFLELSHTTTSRITATTLDNQPSVFGSLHVPRGNWRLWNTD